MADAKISALSAITSLAAADQLAVAHSGASNSIRADHMPGFELDYVTRTSNLTITATTAATAQAICDGNAVSYDGSTRVKIEFFAAECTPGTAGNMVIELWDGSTDLGLISIVGASGGGIDQGIYGVVFLTPSNASHTYHIKIWKSGATGTFTVFAGTAFSGSNPTADPPAFMRITVA